MFIFHIAYSLDLITLTGGVFLYAWGSRKEGPGTGVAKVFGLIIIILSILSTLCTTYYGVKYWQQGYFENPMRTNAMMQDGMMGGNGMPKGMMENCMTNCKNMSGGMMGSPGMNQGDNSNNKDHMVHHQQ